MNEEKRVRKYVRTDIQKAEDARVGGFGIRLVEKVFLQSLLRHDGKLVSAYRDAFPDEKVSATTMLKRAKRIVERDRVKEYMKQMLVSKEISPEFVLGGITEIAKGAKRDSDRLHGYELLGKFLKMFKTESKGSTTLNLNINEDTARRLLERRERHEVGGRGDFIDVNGRGEDRDIIDGEEIID
jgi:hypothetical protein